MVRKSVIAVVALALLTLGVAIIVYVGVARDRLTPHLTPTSPGRFATLTPVGQVTLVAGETLIHGVVSAYEPGGLIIVIRPTQGQVQQIIVTDDVPVVLSDGTRASKMSIGVEQEIEAVGTMDALGRLVASRITLLKQAVTPTPISTPTSSPDVVPDRAWQSEFFAGQNIIGAPVLVREDDAVSFDWGLGSPAVAVPADGFAARFIRRMDMAEGHYSFYAQADDGVRLWVDDILVIDAWDGPSGIVQADVLLNEAIHTLRVEYREAAGQAFLHLWWNNRAQYPDWQGAYYDNMNLAGAPVLVRNDAAVDFDWGNGSPDPAVPADRFSVRWQRTVSLPSGAYQFSATADDGVSVWVDGLRIIDVWPRGSGQVALGHIWLAEGPHAIRVEYQEEGGGASVHLGWSRLQTFTGWKGEYYDNAQLAGEPAFVRDDPAVEFAWEDRSPGPGLAVDNFSVRWTRDLFFEEGTYSFFAVADDGVRVHVDGTTVIDAWRDSEVIRYDGDLELNQGTHRVVVEYYERGQDATISLGWGIVITPTPSPSVTPTATPTPSPSVTPTGTATKSPSVTPTGTATTSPTITVTPTATSVSPTPSPTEAVAAPTLAPTKDDTVPPVEIVLPTLGVPPLN